MQSKKEESKKDRWITYILSHKIILLELLGLTIIAIVFRFYNYDNRWGLASDQARDAIIAIEAVRLHTVPLIGPFSASGPFVFGPYMYWFLIILRILFPFSFLSLWIGMTIGSVIMVLFTILIGKEIKNLQFGFLLAFFSAISPAKIGMATNLISSTLASFISTISVYFFIRSIKYSDAKDLFFLGFFVGFAMNTHFQAIPLFVLLPIAWILGKRTLKNIGVLLGGFCIPFVPLLVFDIKTHFYESTHIIQYMFFTHTPGQIPTRWLVFAGQTVPQMVRLIIGGNIWIAYGSLLFTVGILAFLLVKRQLDRVIIGCGVSVIFFIVILRYFQGQIFGDFTAFLQTLVLILVCYSLWKLMEYQKYVAYLVIVLLTIFTVRTGYHRTSTATNLSSDNAQNLENVLMQKYPHNAVFSLYDYQYKTPFLSLPLSLYLAQDNKADTKGIKIGLSETYIPNSNLFFQEKEPYYEFLTDLSSYSDSQLKKMGWVSVDPKSVYDSVENWYK